MRNDSRPDWWRLRRVRWPIAVTLLLAVAAAIAVVRARASRVVVYNDTGAAITDLTITACGQSQTFREVGERDSIRLTLARTGSESDIAIATNGVPLWRGDYIEPRGGYRATVRLRADGQVECSTTISCWQAWLNPSTTDTN